MAFGYITSDGEFVLPEEAWQIASSCGQIDNSFDTFTHYSDDFYHFGGHEFDLEYAKKKIKEQYDAKKRVRKIN